MPLTVTLHKLGGAGPKQLAIADEACRHMERALNDPGFADRVASAEYRETRFRDAAGSRSIPVSDLAGMIALGQERGTPADGRIDLAVNLHGFRRGILGSTVPGKLPFRTAYWFINDCIKYDEPAELAGHFMHEWLHVCGFHHWPDNKARKDVAYNVGQIVRDLSRDKQKSAKSMPDWLSQGSCGAAVEDANADIADESIEVARL